jgi:hypothetical protein
MRQLRASTIEELLGEVFSVRSVPRYPKQDKSGILLVVRQSQASKDVNTEVEGSATLEDVTRQRLL